MNSPDVFNSQLEIYMAEQYGISWITWDMDGWMHNQYGSRGDNFLAYLRPNNVGGAIHFQLHRLKRT